MKLGIYIISVLIFFIGLRYLIKKDVFDSIDGFFVLVVLSTGFVPCFNITAIIGLYIGYFITHNDLTAEDLIKKILFIK